MADNKIYSTGGTGKNYVYNPDTGNIMVNGKVVTPTDSAYNATKNAMVADTGKSVTPANTTVAPGGSWRTQGQDVIHTVEGKDYVVNPGDPKYSAALEAYLATPEATAAQAQAQTPASAPADNSTDMYATYAKILQDSMTKQQNAYDNQLAAAIGTYTTAIEDTNRAYDQAAKNAYINKMMTMKAMPQQLAAMGLSRTGASETSILNAATNYQNLLNNNEMQRASSIQAIRDKVAQMQAQGGMDKASMEAALAQTLANSYMNMATNDQQYQRELAANALARRQNLEDMAYESAQRQKESRINALLELGIINDEVAAFFGVDKATLQRAYNAIYGM